MLVVPYGGDQYDNGARVARLGVGRVMRRNHYRTERAAVELQHLLESPNYMKKAATIGQQMHRENGVWAACDAIEKQLHTQKG